MSQCSREPEADDSVATEIVESIYESCQILRNRLNESFSDIGLTEIRYTVLQVITDAGDDYSQSRLAETLQQSESSVSTLVERMRASGLLYRLESRTDRRRRVLRLTEQGTEMLSQGRRVYASCVARALNNVPVEQRHEIVKSLRLLVKGLQGDHAISTVPAPVDSREVGLPQPVKPVQAPAA